MKTKTKIKLVTSILKCTRANKNIGSIPGTCGRIKLDVGDVNSGLRMFLFGSINSRKVANEKRQCVGKCNGFMCKSKTK